MINDEYMPPGILIINGFPGSGKTTIARLIAELCPRGTHINGDEIHNLVLGGRIHPPGDPEDEKEVNRQLELRERNIALLADNFFISGYLPVIDNFMSSKVRLNHLLSQIRSYPVAMVVLNPGLEVSLKRDQVRLEKNVGHIYKDLYDELIKELSGVGLWLDTAEMTIEETSREVMMRAFSEGIIRG